MNVLGRTTVSAPVASVTLTGITTGRLYLCEIEDMAVQANTTFPNTLTVSFGSAAAHRAYNFEITNNGSTMATENNTIVWLGFSLHTGETSGLQILFYVDVDGFVYGMTHYGKHFLGTFIGGDGAIQYLGNCTDITFTVPTTNFTAGVFSLSASNVSLVSETTIGAPVTEVNFQGLLTAENYLLVYRDISYTSTGSFSVGVIPLLGATTIDRASGNSYVFPAITPNAHTLSSPIAMGVGSAGGAVGKPAGIATFSKSGDRYIGDWVGIHRQSNDAITHITSTFIPEDAQDGVRFSSSLAMNGGTVRLFKI